MTNNESITVEDWLNAGYKKYKQQSFNSADYLPQKCIRDKHGKCYYINVRVYEHFTKDYFKDNGGIPRVGFSPEVQFQRGSKSTMDVSLIINNSTSIAEVEREFYDLWVMLGKPYYDRNE